MRPGTKILVRFIRIEGDIYEPATIRKTTKSMLPMPAGYVPVKFSDGGRLLVHIEHIYTLR